MKIVGTYLRRKPLLMVMLLAVGLFLFSYGISGGDTNDPHLRPDIITIVAASSVDQLERPPVQFPHGLHTEAIKAKNEDCTSCHLVRDNGRLSPLFMRLEDRGNQDVEEIYHDKCIGCHVERAAEGAKSGPEACGDCHRKQPLYQSSLVPFGFDISLHYRHIKANDDKCETCHHIYDEASKKTVYVKGQENPCRDCHRSETQDNRLSFRLVAHESCIGCHRERILERPNEKVGPVVCAGCHDRDRQRAIEVVENPPRLQRGQPDFVLLSAPEDELESSKLNTVPFSHVQHERSSKTCRVCHHETLANCSQCHTLSGSEKSDGVTLQQAMHRMTSKHSCVGCHQAEKSEPACAGCHDLMEKGRLSEHACGICHAGPSPDELSVARSRYTSLEEFQPAPSETALSISTSEIPDTVTIARLVSQYPPVKMPHRKIVDALRARIADSKIATYFHGNEDVVCQGCHHHGSIGRKPALCENCHGAPFNVSDLFKPGLKGAFHRQCLGCHLSMGLQTVSNCTVCHGNNTADRGGMTTRSTSGEITNE